MDETNSETTPDIPTDSTPPSDPGTAPPRPKPYRRPCLNTILNLFPPEHRAHIEHSLTLITAATPFLRHPIDALASAIHRLATDLERITLAHDPTTPPDDPQKIIAIAALATAAEHNIIQPATSRLQRILNDFADLPTDLPSSTEDRTDQTAREKRQRLQAKLDNIRHAAIRRNTRAESAAQKRVEADGRRRQKQKLREINAMKKRVREREKTRVKNKWER